MKKAIVVCLSLFALLFSAPYSFADDSAEDHICFKRIDSNHDEIVTFDEFKKFYGDDLKKYQAMDQDNDGKLTHDEYEEYLYNQED